MPVPYRRSPIPGWTGYEVDTEGFVWSCRNARGMGQWHTLKPGLSNHYPTVWLRSGAGTKTIARYVHHLVLEVFAGPCPDGLEAIHENDDKTDNRLENLSWGTHDRNCKLRRLNGKDKFGEDRKNSKLTNAQVLWIRSNVGVISYAKMARTCGVTAWTVREVAEERSWRHLLATQPKI